MAGGGQGSDTVVTYKDGTKASVRIGIREIVEMERRWKGEIIPALESTLFGAWFGLGQPGESFDDWLATVDEITEEDTPADPSPPAAGDE